MLFHDSPGSSVIFKELIYHKNVTPNKLTPDVWSDVPVIKCTSLPQDIDGNYVYELPFNPYNRMISFKDGRKWRRYMPSKRFGFKDALPIVVGCSVALTQHVPSEATIMAPTRYILISETIANFVVGPLILFLARRGKCGNSTNLTKLLQYGSHTCPVVVRNTSNVAVSALKKKFGANPTMKPKAAVNSLISEAIKSGQS